MITVIYYTSNREKETFEQKIREKLFEAIGNLPLISISHKPIEFGYNICVGDIEVCDKSILEQILIGCEAADTPFVAMAEADCLYPLTGYFDFEPDDIDAVYRYTNLWILSRRWKHYRKKAYSLSGQIAGRKYLMKRIKKILGPPFIERKDIVNKKTGWIPFESSVPIINIKTNEGMRKVTGTIKDISPEESLPYWGTAMDLKKELGI